MTGHNDTQTRRRAATFKAILSSLNTLQTRNDTTEKQQVYFTAMIDI